jgi:soluble lytic murein transglycosylase-like protein
LVLKRLTQLVAIVAFAACTLGAQAADLAVLRNGFEIRHERRQVIGDTTRLYLTAALGGGYVDVKSDQIVTFERDESVRPKSATATQAANSRARQSTKPVDVNAAVTTASKMHAIDPDLISSVIRAESSFNPKAVSPKGAQGLMQLMPGTASKLGVKNSFDANANVDGGTRYLRELLLRYQDDLPKALAAYNAGPHRVDQYRGVPPYSETRAYVARIIRDFNRKKLAEQRAAAARLSTRAKRVNTPKSRSGVAESHVPQSGAGS